MMGIFSNINKCLIILPYEIIVKNDFQTENVLLALSFESDFLFLLINIIWPSDWL